MWLTGDGRVADNKGSNPVCALTPCSHFAVCLAFMLAQHPTPSAPKQRSSNGHIRVLSRNMAMVTLLKASWI